MIAAMTQDCVISAQITEGGTDAVVFDNFLHRTLTKLRVDKDTKWKQIVILMDNASIHKHSSIYETSRKFKANVLLNAQYSPWLNPVEQLFNCIKRRMRANKKKPDR
jgi:DDE superfamily endonuclease